MRLAFRGVVAVTVGVMLMGVLGLAGSGAALGHDYSKGSLHIDHPRSRATPKGAEVAAGYLTIENAGTAPDRLLAVKSEIAKRVEVHEMSMTGGVMKMRPLPKGLAVESGKTVKLEPSGYHLMFMGLNRQLAKGDRFKATLEFEKAGPIDVEFAVEGMGGH
jgi:copper(I)-binding protein